MIESRIPLIDDILGSRRDIIGNDFAGYRNHVHRMVNFCYAQGDFAEEEKEKIAIAGCFHDIGIWTGDTFDYLSPSIVAATDYLERNGLDPWISEIGLMIDQHHKVRHVPVEPSSLVEVFRRGDLVDFSLGLIKCGLPGSVVREVKTAFPNAGFHKTLVKRAGRWICRHPLNPVPVLKW